jgi:hypothetical protein
MSVSAHLAVQRNAFSTAQAAAKVCDGAASASIAERISCVQIAKSTNGATAFALLPTITGHAWLYEAANTTASTGSPNSALIAAPTAESFANTIHAFTGWNEEAITVVADANAMAVEKVKGDASEITAAGVVTSATGKKITYLKKNKDAPDQMQGWFEAIRVRPSWGTEGLRLFPVGSAKPFTSAALGPTAEFWEQGIIMSSNWANDPSYVTGRLRDIGKHTFYLQPTKPRKFHRWPNEVNAVSFDDVEEQPCGFDPCFDVVLVRCYSAPNSTATLSQTIHCHVVKNWETMYDSNKPMARFHTSTIAAKKAVEYADKQMTRDPKASMIRSASSYGYRY